MRREMPFAKFVILTITTNKLRRRNSGDHAEQGFQLVSSNRITHKSQMLIAKVLEKCPRLKPWQFALSWLPSPVEIIFVRPPMAHAILAIFNCTTSCTIVQRSQLVTYPFPIRVVTRSWSIRTINICKKSRQKLLFSYIRKNW